MRPNLCSNALLKRENVFLGTDAQDCLILQSILSGGCYGISEEAHTTLKAVISSLGSTKSSLNCTGAV